MGAVKNHFHDEICGRAAFEDGELNPDALHDLYEALVAIIAAEDAGEGWAPAYKAAVEALAKARGEA